MRRKKNKVIAKEASWRRTRLGSRPKQRIKKREGRERNKYNGEGRREPRVDTDQGDGERCREGIRAKRRFGAWSAKREEDQGMVKEKMKIGVDKLIV